MNVGHWAQQFDAVAFGDVEDLLDRRRVVGGQLCGAADESLHRSTGCVDLEGHPIQIGLEAMWNATRTEPKGIVEIKIAE